MCNMYVCIYIYLSLSLYICRKITGCLGCYYRSRTCLQASEVAVSSRARSCKFVVTLSTRCMTRWRQSGLLLILAFSRSFSLRLSEISSSLVETIVEAVGFSSLEDALAFQLETPSFKSSLVQVNLRDPARSNNRYLRCCTRTDLTRKGVFYDESRDPSGREDHGEIV